MTLFQSFTLPNGVSLRNRFVMAPMTTYAGHDNGDVSDEELAYYRARANGVGMLITACAHVAANGQAFRGQIAAHDDAFIPSLRRIAETIQQGGAKAILQIHHGGRQARKALVPNEDIVSASAVAGSHGELAREATTAEVDALVDAYAQATRRAIAAGFDGVEIHGANTYLIQQFFSGFTNKRTDKYGGTLEKRLTFPIAVAEAVLNMKKAHASDDFIIGYRFSPEEPEEDGITMDDTAVLLARLQQLPLDYMHISLGDYRSTTHRYKKGEVNRIREVRALLRDDLPLIGVGSIYEAHEAEEAHELGADFVALGRALLIEPQWVEKVAAGEAVATTIDASNPQVIPPKMFDMLRSRAGWIPGL